MPNFLSKKPRGLSAEAYVFPAAADLTVSAPPASEPDGAPPQEPSTPVDYAQVQAEAIVKDARREAEAIREKARQAAKEELETLRREARSRGYQLGFAEGMANAMTEAREQREQQTVQQAREIAAFLEAAARQRDQILEQTKEELKDLALAIAEKIIRISLKSSGDVVLRMIQAALERHKRCEWAHIYLAGCDLRTLVYTIPELTAALRHVSDRVHIIPMDDDESGTCILELPHEIIDASVSTQLENIRTVLSNIKPDRDDGSAHV